jgi:hypothetical protein
MPSHEVKAEASAPLARYPEHGPHRDEPYIGAYQPLLEAGLAAARDDGMRADVVGRSRRPRIRRVDAGLPAPCCEDGAGATSRPRCVSRPNCRGETWSGMIAAHLLKPAGAALAGRAQRRAPAAASTRSDPRARHGCTPISWPGAASIQGPRTTRCRRRGSRATRVASATASSSFQCTCAAWSGRSGRTPRSASASSTRGAIAVWRSTCWPSRSPSSTGPGSSASAWYERRCGGSCRRSCG